MRDEGRTIHYDLRLVHPSSEHRSFSGRGEVQQIVNQLEGRAQVQTVVAQRLLLALVCPAEDRADLAAGAEEIRGLAQQYVEVLLLADVCAAQGGQLQQLALGHLARDRG